MKPKGQLSKKDFIGFRVHPLVKSALLEEAITRGVTLSDLVTEYIEIGWEQMGEKNVKPEHTGRTGKEMEFENC